MCRYTGISHPTDIRLAMCVNVKIGDETVTQKLIFSDKPDKPTSPLSDIVVDAGSKNGVHRFVSF